MRARKSAVLIAGLALTAAGCSGAGETAASADGPIKIMAIASFESPAYSVPWLKTALDAGVESVNSAGGVDGRQIEILMCNDKFDPNEATACAQRAIEEKVVAIVGGLTPNSGTIAPVLEAAQIPFIAPAGADGKAESTSEIMYPLNAGPVGFATAAGVLAVQRGGKKVAVVSGDNPGARLGGEWTAAGVEAAGGTAELSYAPLGAADYSALAGSVLGQNPDAIAMSGAGSDLVRVIRALRQAGFGGIITGQASMMTNDSLKALGPDAEGILITGRGLPSSQVSNPLIKEFNDDMRAADPAVNIDDIGLNGWLGVKVFADVIKGHTITDGASVIEAFDHIDTPVDLQGVYVDYAGVPDHPALPDYPRMPTPAVMTSTVQNGALVPAGEFFNPFDQG
jgi:ABC-type branched-subunit amino acid transport system substrate-binding protein